MQTILGDHPVMRAIIGAAERLAASGRAVAVVGERGTGKELVARHLHAAASRSGDSFVRVDCTENDAGRLEHELFIRHGGWRRATSGTLLLDDLPQLPADLQARLARELAAAALAVQVVATFEQEIAVARRAGRVDAALLEHLSPLEVVLPALRLRRSDIPLLVQHFLTLYSARHGAPCRTIETDALVYLWQYDWPGNVRELESVIERVVVLCPRAVIRAGDLPHDVRAGAGAPGLIPPGAATAIGCGGPSLRPAF